jgi:hypothetical protein
MSRAKEGSHGRMSSLRGSRSFRLFELHASGGEAPGVNKDQKFRGRAWCVLRNLVHTVYREVRHLGPKGDTKARVTVPSGPLLASAKRCRRARAELKSSHLHRLTAHANTVADVLRPYQEKTGLSVNDLICIFKLPTWQPKYGGPKWAAITETLKELIFALELGDSVRASAIADRVSLLRHNSGKLVPSLSEWQSTRYLREKWPELCN